MAASLIKHVDVYTCMIDKSMYSDAARGRDWWREGVWNTGAGVVGGVGAKIGRGLLAAGARVRRGVVGGRGAE